MLILLSFFFIIRILKNSMKFCYLLEIVCIYMLSYLLEAKMTSLLRLLIIKLVIFFVTASKKAFVIVALNRRLGQDGLRLDFNIYIKGECFTC